MKLIPGAVGAFGEVWEGTYRGKRVAIKKPRILDFRGQPIQFSEADYDAQNKEYNLWAAFPSHPNVLPVYGAYSDEKTNSLWLISPFILDGSLNQFLKKTEPAPWLDEEWILLVLTHVAQGLAHLHDHNSLHLDGIFYAHVTRRLFEFVSILNVSSVLDILFSVAFRNILWDNTLRRACLCDFGLSRRVSFEYPDHSASEYRLLPTR